MKNALLIELAATWELQAETGGDGLNRLQPPARETLRACADTLRMLVDAIAPAGAQEAQGAQSVAPAAVQGEPTEGDLPPRVWLNDMGTTQKLSFSPIDGACEHFEYVPASPPQAAKQAEAAPAQPSATAVALRAIVEAWDAGEIEWFKRCYDVMDAGRAALAQRTGGEAG